MTSLFRKYFRIISFLGSGIERDSTGAVTCAMCPESPWLVTFWLERFKRRGHMECTAVGCVRRNRQKVTATPYRLYASECVSLRSPQRHVTTVFSAAKFVRSHMAPMWPFYVVSLTKLLNWEPRARWLSTAYYLRDIGAMDNLVKFRIQTERWK